MEIIITVTDSQLAKLETVSTAFEIDVSTYLEFIVKHATGEEVEETRDFLKLQDENLDALRAAREEKDEQINAYIKAEQQRFNALEMRWARQKAINDNLEKKLDDKD